MILDKLKEYVKAHPYCTQAQLAKVFFISEDGVEAMMSVWGKKGALKTFVKKEKGKRITQYCWIEKEEIGFIQFL